LLDVAEFLGEVNLAGLLVSLKRPWMANQTV
jgi:hypothetical protein